MKGLLTFLALSTFVHSAISLLLINLENKGRNQRKKITKKAQVIHLIRPGTRKSKLKTFSDFNPHSISTKDNDNLEDLSSKILSDKYELRGGLRGELKTQEISYAMSSTKKPGNTSTKSTFFSEKHKSIKSAMEDLEKSGVGSVDKGLARSMRKSTMDIIFPVPKGVSVNKLNKFQQMIYSFEKRVNYKYTASVLSRVREHNQHAPHYKIPEAFPKQLITFKGVITFKKDGSTPSFKIIESSHKNNNEYIHKYFEKVIKDQTTIQNIPGIFFHEKNTYKAQFNLYLDFRA